VDFVEIKTEVLVIGGGLAGLMSALSASRSGRNVVLVCRGLVGRSGNTMVSGGGIASATADPDNSAELFGDDLNRSAKGLNNPVLTQKLAVESFRALRFLETCGVKLIREGQGYKRRMPPGHAVPRNIPTDWTDLSYLNRGLSFTLPLVGKLQKQQVRFVEQVRVVKLLKNLDRVVGAIGRDRTGVWYRFLAGSVVLATGGAGFLYRRTNNTSDITGDGLSLALQAGCRLQDMEQIQFYPSMMFSPLKVPISNPLFGAGAVLRNRDGEMFMEKYDPAGNMATRDSMARAIFLEIQAGRGVDNSVYFDCTQIPQGRLSELFKDFYGFLLQCGVDPSQEYLKVSPCVHYTLGGIRIDPYCHAGVPGLYAAGEICGGIHGANRLSGSALMEACVFGLQAGSSAAEEATWGDGGQSGARAVPALASQPRERDPHQAKDLLERLRKIMWDQVSLLRSEEGLSTALGELESMKSELSAVPDENGPAASMLRVAEAIVSSAQLRRESRGAHYRSDFPHTDSQYDGNTVCWQVGEELSVVFEKQAENVTR
jgi:aspartate oxidase